MNAKQRRQQEKIFAKVLAHFTPDEFKDAVEEFREQCKITAKLEDELDRLFATNAILIQALEIAMIGGDYLPAERRQLEAVLAKAKGGEL